MINTNFPSDRQWTIRIIPWASMIALIVVGAMFFLAITRNQLSWIFILPLSAAIIAILLFSEYITCEIDLDVRKVVLRHVRIWRTSEREFQINDLQAVTVHKQSDSDGSTYNVSFALKSGELIRVTQPSSGKRGKEKMAQAITDYINQVQYPQLQAALDGVVRIQRDGVTDGIDWQMEFIFDNDNVALTRWKANSATLPSGFILLIPAQGAKNSSIPGGIIGSVVRSLYGRYLRLFDIAVNNLPGFDQAEFLQGKQFGLHETFAILTSNKEATRNWLTPERAQQLNDWIINNPLKANKAEAEPHILVTLEGLSLVFRKTFNQEQQVDVISRLGAALTR